MYLDKIYKAIGENCLQRNVQLSGFDFSRAALEWGSCKYKNLKPKNVETILIPGDFVKALNSIEPDSTDMIFSLEVTEHLEDDEKFLSLTSKVLKEDGFLILSVPNSEPSFLSFDWFRYVFNHKKLIEKDIRVGHYRRYTTNKLHMMLNKVGFTTLKTEYYDFFWGDLIEFFLTQCFKRDSIFKKIFFYFCLPIIWLEDYVLNFLKVKRSGGIFILAQKTKSLDI